MKRRALLVVVVLAVMLAVAWWSVQRHGGLPFGKRAHENEGSEAPSAAVLIEMGLKDDVPADWSGQAAVTGATVVRSEGYRFHSADQLLGRQAWKASSHRPLRLPPNNPALARSQGIASVGVVLYLADVQAGATLTLSADSGGRAPGQVPLDEVLAGAPVKLWEGAAAVRRLSIATPLGADSREDDFPAAAAAPDGTIWVAYISYQVRDAKRQVEQADLREQPRDFRSYYEPYYADQLMVQYSRDGRWSAPVAVTGTSEDLVRCAVAVAGSGRAWVIYSARRQGGYELCARSLELTSADAAVQVGEESRLAAGPGPCLNPVACTDRDGRVHVAYQSGS
jgi:hypothetical protein